MLLSFADGHRDIAAARRVAQRSGGGVAINAEDRLMLVESCAGNGTIAMSIPLSREEVALLAN